MKIFKTTLLAGILLAFPLMKTAFTEEIQLLCEENQSVGFYFNEGEKKWKPAQFEPSEFSFILRKPLPKDDEQISIMSGILPNGPYEFVAVTTGTKLILNACTNLPNEGGYIKCGGSSSLEINVKTGMFTKSTSRVAYLFEWENPEEHPIIEPVQITLGKCKKLF